MIPLYSDAQSIGILNCLPAVICGSLVEIRSRFPRLPVYWTKELGKKNIYAFQPSKRGGYLHCKLLGNDRISIGGGFRHQGYAVDKKDSGEKEPVRRDK